MEPTFAVVEVMGYQVYAGRVSMAQVFGASFCQKFPRLVQDPRSQSSLGGPASTV